MYHLLSYPIEAHMPAWPDSPQLQLEKKLQIAKGDVANTSIISLYNHVGTHYDAPNHYLASGTPIAELDLDRFIFERPLLLEIPKGAGEKVTAADPPGWWNTGPGCGRWQWTLCPWRPSVTRRTETKPIGSCSEGRTDGSSAASRMSIWRRWWEKRSSGSLPCRCWCGAWTVLR